MESDDGSWWVMLAVSAGATLVLGAILLSVIAVVVLGVGWVRRRRS
ncbi:hypothetical protein ACIBL6_22690 [Streptomyces sp. NPDC050400]